MSLLRLLLFPFSLIYDIILTIRNKFYDWGCFKSYEFEIPVISVGNLMVGGTGKSPMTEYLVRLLKDKYKVAILSRGYGRKTKGFIEVLEHFTVEETGDEPLQFKRKFTDITVAVCESRIKGITILSKNCDLIILDDAYQHRAVKPGLSLLLFDYPRLHYPKVILPAGQLREGLSGIKRADALIITKISNLISKKNIDKDVARFIRPQNKPVFYSTLKYGELIGCFDRKKAQVLNLDTTIFLLTGLANSKPLLNYLQTKYSYIIHHKYADHHSFSTKNITKLVNEFNSNTAINKVIITTEKDFQRLQNPQFKTMLRHLPFFYLPIETEISFNESTEFNNLIESYVAKHSYHN